MPRLTRAEKRATFLHVLHEIFDLDVGNPLALALDNCGIVTVTDLVTLTQEMIAALEYPNALQPYDPGESAGTQEIALMPLTTRYKDMLEWFIQWANALFLVNDSVPLSAVEWQSMTTADFDSYRTSMGTYTPIIRASRMKSPDCTTLADARAAKMPSPDCATPADAELCTPTSTSYGMCHDATRR